MSDVTEVFVSVSVDFGLSVSDETGFGVSGLAVVSDEKFFIRPAAYSFLRAYKKLTSAFPIAHYAYR